ncbi:MAG: hypothetical protein HY796_12290, partial [Elusimicrobia bacterium]|nr:hypothetical protein [Elusimicrobiota bacterium]
VRIVQQIAVYFAPQNCEASVIEQLCSSVTSFLNDEAAKADTALKNCTKNCGWKKRKDDLVDAARKKAKESCSKGEAPDVNELSKGLDRNIKDRLKNLYNRNSRMFDGTAKLAAKDLRSVPSNSAATLTGKGGQVTDLKFYEPNTPKLNPTAEFSLSGTKLSGETPGQTTTKQSSILLASASSAKTQADAPIASTKTALSPQKAQEAATAQPKCTASATLCMSVVPGKPCSCPTENLCDAGPGVAGMCMSAKYCAGEGCPQPPENGAGKPSLWDRLMGRTEPCGKSWYNKNKKCCVNGKILEKCGAECYDPKTTCCKDGKTYEKCEEKCYNPKTKCCLADRKFGTKCNGDCYDPQTECCEDGKRDEKCEKKCARIGKRIKAVEKFLTGYTQGNTIGQTDPTATSIARTRCLPGIGPWTRYYSGFKTLDPEVQDGIIAHEEVHRHQCKTLGWLDFPEPEIVREPPAFEAERALLNGKYKERCGVK